jgi:2-haloacid dehalogenase
VKFSDFSVLTFDCYGTLIDWETGLWDSLRPVLAHHGVTVTQDAVLEMFGILESRAEAGEYRTYKVVLGQVLTAMGDQLGFAPAEDELTRFAQSAGDWPPFPDTTRALRALKRQFQLAVISNVDDDLFARTARRLDVTFDWVITAEQVRSYKPSHNNFMVAFERIGVPRGRILHVAQSLFHDVAPAKSLGLSTVWVNRRHGKTGSGATPPAHATPDLEVPDLDALAVALQVS